MLIFKMFFIFYDLTRYFPRQLFRLMRRDAVPFKRRSYFSDYLQLWNVGKKRKSEREINGLRQCLWWQLNAMIGYTIVLIYVQYSLKFVDDRVTNVEMWRFALFDLTHYMVTQDPETKVALTLLLIFAIYFNYRSYRKVELKFLLFFDRLVFRRTGWRSFFPARNYRGVSIERLVRVGPLVVVNGFQLFVLVNDLLGILIVWLKIAPFFQQISFEKRNLLVIAKQITVGLFSAFNLFCLLGSVLLYMHLFSLQGTMGITGLFALYVRISQNQAALRQKRWSSNTIARFQRFNVGSIEHIGVANHALADLFVAFLLCNAPVNVYFVTQLSLNRIDKSLVGEISFTAMVGHQVLTIFCFHYFIAQISKRFHRSGSLLLGLYVRYQLVGSRRRVCARLALRVSQIIARLHVTRRYGIMYSRIALVSMPLFVKFVLLYSEFWMFLYQQIRHH